MEENAQGRVWTGNDAASRGLVDAIGGMGRAIAIAKQKANIPQEKEVFPKILWLILLWLLVWCFSACVNLKFAVVTCTQLFRVSISKIRFVCVIAVSSVCFCCFNQYRHLEEGLEGV